MGQDENNADEGACYSKQMCEGTFAYWLHVWDDIDHGGALKRKSIHATAAEKLTMQQSAEIPFAYPERGIESMKLWMQETWGVSGTHNGAVVSVGRLPPHWAKKRNRRPCHMKCASSVAHPRFGVRGVLVQT